MKSKRTITRPLIAGLAVAGFSLGAVACSDDDPEDNIDSPIDSIENPVESLDEESLDG